MNDYVRVMILAVVQGIAEFLPISSKGHLVIIDEILRQGKSADDEALSLIIALHVGTLGSTFFVYFQRIKQMWLESDWRLCGAIVIASIPAGVIGICFKKSLEPLFQHALVAGCGLLVTATLLILTQWVPAGQFTDRKLPWPIAFIVGCFQAVALLPGISRSGSTIAGGLLAGMQRESAGTFSFLIAIPAVGGVAVLEVVKLLRHADAAPGQIPLGALLIGVVISFVVGVIALRLLLQMITKHRLHYFGYYCYLVGTATIIWKLSGN